MKNCPKCGQVYDNSTTLCPLDGEALVKSGDELIGQTLAGKYRIDERISEGGMGTVYRGVHILMEKAVAIKVLHPSLAADEKIVARFTREAKAASRISHPHALTVTDFGESENGIVFLVMEYLRGQTLKQVIRKEGPMSLARVVEIARQVSGALDAAHAEGVVHRDLKSDNIMLEEVGTAGGDWAKVLDFGIAKIQEPVGQDPELTAPNLIIGTPQYMSPEQCSQASEIDARSDIYSFGVIIYEMLVGHVPFIGDSATTIMLKHLQEPAPSVLEERKDLPPAVGEVIARALSKRREERQQSAGELAEALASSALTVEAAGTHAAVANSNNSEGRDHAKHNTDRILVPTSQLDARSTANDDYDEATVVRPSATNRAASYESGAYDAAPSPPSSSPSSAASFNPWYVLIPAAFLVLVVGGIFYAMQHKSGAPAANSNNASPLASDPNAQPVQPAQPPTGANESGILPSTNVTTVSPTPSGTSGVGTSNRNANANNEETMPPIDNANTNTNRRGQLNDNAQQNDNSPAVTEPTPAPTNKNDNQRRIAPQPLPTVNANVAPLPTPPQRKQPATDPTPPPRSTGTAAPIEGTSPPPSL